MNKRTYSHEASETRSIMRTNAAGIVRTIIQIRRQLNSYDFGATDFDYTTGSVAATKALCPAITNLRRSSSLDILNYYCAAICD